MNDTTPIDQKAVPQPRRARQRPIAPSGALTSTEARSDAMETAGQQPYLGEENTFMRVVAAERTKAQRLIQDLNDDIERMEAEINLRKARRSGLEMVVARADAALGSPALYETVKKGDEG